MIKEYFVVKTRGDQEKKLRKRKVGVGGNQIG